MVTFGQKAKAQKQTARHADRTTLPKHQPPAFPKPPALKRRHGQPQRTRGAHAGNGGMGGLRPKRSRHNWTQPERDFIRLNYQGSIESRRYLASVLKVSDHAVAGQIARMGLCRRTSRTKWTPDEDEVLRTLLPKHSHIKVAKIMHRSVNAVVVRAKRLEVSRRERDDWFTLADASQILGVDHRWIATRISNGTLKASLHYPGAKSDDSPRAHHISRSNLRNFIRRYPEELNANNLDLISVVDLLSGVLPV